MFPCQEIRDMIVRDYPDFVRFNNLRQRKGLPRIIWAEYSYLRASGALREAVEGLQDGGATDTLLDSPPACTVFPSPLEGYQSKFKEIQPGELVLTKDMEVKKNNNYEEVSVIDASGPIYQEYET